MQKKVKEFIINHQLDCDLNTRYMDLVSEIGELGKEIIKGSDYGKYPYKNTEHLKMELGDCLFSLLALAIKSDIDAEEALTMALNKYEDRKKHFQNISSNKCDN